MLSKVILINSANFNFLEVDLKKDLFFLGDNGSGKTTLIRAIHYLFSGDVRNLGIPSDKDGFKEYYFQYDNSYIIYTFDDFFIFMYKVGNEIVKFFSKQKFDLSYIVDENNQLKTLSEIQRYIKQAPLQKRVKSVSEYRDIVYGSEEKYKDFKFSSITNSEVFIGLFNEIFNIDKSIIDAKSIKQAIQTTLDKQKFISFNYEDYIQNIYQFQSEYKFFKEFEKQKGNIDKAYMLKNRLLEFENKISDIQSFMVYRADIEVKFLEEAIQDIKSIDNNISKKEAFKDLKKKILLKCEDRFLQQSNNLVLEIERLLKLKEKFSQKNILMQKDIADRYEDIKQSQLKLNQSYTKLKSGFETQLDNIEKEITSLKYKRDKELLREFEDKKFNKEQLLRNELIESIKGLDLSLESNLVALELKVENLKNIIKNHEEQIVKNKKMLNVIDDKYNEEIKKEKEFSHEEETRIIKSIQDKINLQDLKQREINKLKYEIDDIELYHKKELDKIDLEYNDNLKNIDNEINRYKRMIFAKANSFKEFLNDEVDGWEDELYPILDDRLLDIDIENLKPKILDSETIFSISLDKTNLKKILTKSQAEEMITSLEEKKVSLDDVYQKSISLAKSGYEKRKFSLDEKIAIEQNLLNSIEDEILKDKESIKIIRTNLEVKLFDILKMKNEEELKLQENIFKLHKEILKCEDEIKKIYRDISILKVENSKNIKGLQEKLLKDIQLTKTTFDKNYEKAKNDIDKEIEKKELEKYKVTKDDRLKEIEKELVSQEENLTKAIKAKEFLKEFFDVKDSIDMLDEKNQSLKYITLKNNEFKNRLLGSINKYDLDIQNYFKVKKELSQNIKRLKESQQKFQKIAEDFLDIEPKESIKNLDELIDTYRDMLVDYKNDKVDFKTVLTTINTLENIQNEIDIYFDFDDHFLELFVSEFPNILTKVDEIFEFKNKKIDIIKQNGHKKFINFVQNLLPQQISVFNDSEDKFFQQVQKINENLSKIDFGVIKDIKIETKLGDKKSIAKLLHGLHENVLNLSSLLNESSLFYDESNILDELDSLEDAFIDIKKELKGSAISLTDTIDLSLSFVENSKKITNVVQLKNESSTGGTMLLKIALAISILKLFIVEEKTPFFLIVDEVSRLHSINQERLREFANEKGFNIIFVTPEPTYSKPDVIKYYRFRKNSDDEFEAIELNYI